MSTTDSAPDDLDEEDIPEVDDVEFGPFGDARECDFEYGGIEETCGDEATHSITWNIDGQLVRMSRCDDHGFPWVVRERKAMEYGYPPRCQACPQLGRPVALANETAGTADLETTDGDMETFYVCEECADALDVQLEDIDSA